MLARSALRGAPRPEAASFVGSVVQFGAIVPNAEGWNLFVFLVLRRVNGWLIGLTQNGHPAGIAENNIAWANVLDPGPRQASDRLVLSYVGTRKACFTVVRVGRPHAQRARLPGVESALHAGAAGTPRR